MVGTVAAVKVQSSRGQVHLDRRPTVIKDVVSPRIYYLHPRLGGELTWTASAHHAKWLGFSHLLLAWPFSTSNDLFLTNTVSHIGQREAASVLGALAKDCQALGLKLWIDLAVGRAEAKGQLVAVQTGCWEEPQGEPLDPRNINARNVVEAAFGDAEARDRLIPFWQNKVLEWQDLGVSGVRCHNAKSLPLEIWSKILAPGQDASPSFQTLAWMPDTSPDMRSKAGSVFDFVPSSVAWWDGTESWLIEEYNNVAEGARLIGFPEDPFASRRPARSPVDPERHSQLSLMSAALLADGWLMPMGFEHGMETPFLHAQAEDFAAASRGSTDLQAAVLAANQAAAVMTSDDGGSMRSLQLGGSLDVIARCAKAGPKHLIVLNRDLVNDRSIDLNLIAARLNAVPNTQASLFNLRPAMGTAIALRTEIPAVISASAKAPEKPDRLEKQRIVIEGISPTVDGGRFPVKRLVGDLVEVTADIFSDGHDVLAAELLWRADDEAEWSRAPMTFIANDRWQAWFPLLRHGRHVFAIEAWWSEFGTFRRDLIKKRDAGLDIAVEIAEGRLIMEKFVRNAAPADRAVIEEHLKRLGQSQFESAAVLLTDTLDAAMERADPRPHATGSEAAFTVEADRQAASFSSWYELFPRSITDSPARHGHFRDVIGRLPAIKAMGFDVLYFPPIHPIGKTNRKGRNNTLIPDADDPGSPYAIGSAEGGHDAIHPQLGSREDFRELVREAAQHGLEIALDFAIQCSPDHPWLNEHPEWFQWRPDGSMRYAENPPKKYQDIVNADFYAAQAIPDLWIALRDVVQSWIDAGVRIFRVDNPHTKPFPFWEWLIADIRSRDPRVLFLAEAFTRPKVMYRLGKIGFSQSYTYFTWRNSKTELTEYLTELNEKPVRDIFRPHFFVNTPDINPFFLQHSGRPGFLIRAALAATLSGLWGVYSGFELCEAAAIPGKEEYLDSEKYEIKPRDWQAPGNIIAEITRLNLIRRNHPALQSHLGLTFYNAFNGNILYFGKRAKAQGEIILVAVNLDPFSAQSANIEVPLWEFGLPDHASIAVEDLMRGHRFSWQGKSQTIELDPREIPFSIWRIAATEGAPL
jgi:starch synthase (maltosyl-transferring)